MKKAIILIHANVYDGTFNMKLQNDVSIEIKDNKISRIGSFEVDNKSKIIDLKGKYVVPGLINLHCHLPSSGKLRHKKLGDLKKLVDFITSNKLTKKIGVFLCKSQLKASINSGITTLRCVGGISDFDTTLRDKINSGKYFGPRLIVCNNAIGVEGGHMVGTVTLPAHNEDEIRSMIDNLYSQKVDAIKLMITGGVLDGTVPGHPGQLAMSENLVKAACDHAHKYGLKVIAHVEGSEGMNVAIRCGVDSLEHTAPFDEKLAPTLKTNNGALVLTLCPARPFIDLPPEVVGYGEIAQINSSILYEGMIETYQLGKKYGINIGLGTDAGSTLVPFYDFYKELIAFSSYCDESSSYALHLGTLGNAKIAGVDSITGSIEVNKYADLLIVENDPILDLKNLGKPIMVFVRGKCIKKPKVKHLKKEDKLISQVKYKKEI